MPCAGSASRLRTAAKTAKLLTGKTTGVCARLRWPCARARETPFAKAKKRKKAAGLLRDVSRQSHQRRLVLAGRWLLATTARGGRRLRLPKQALQHLPRPSRFLRLPLGHRVRPWITCLRRHTFAACTPTCDGSSRATRSSPSAGPRARTSPTASRSSFA